MFICYTDCQDYSMTTNIIWVMEAEITALSAVCSERMHANSLQHVHYWGAEDSQTISFTAARPDRMALWWRRTSPWAAGEAIHFQSPLTEKAVPTRVLKKRQITL